MASHIAYQPITTTRNQRSKLKNQTPFTLWFTGLSGAGKSTLSNFVEQELVARKKHTMLLDGDNIRRHISSDLDFSDDGRVENIRRVAHISKLFNDAGIICIAAFISPFEEDREKAKAIIGEDNFVEIYVKASLEVCMQRDPKGLYKQHIDHFTGKDSIYETPHHAHLVLDTETYPAEVLVKDIFEYLEKNKYIPSSHV